MNYINSRRDNSYKICKINVKVFYYGRSFKAENVDYTSENSLETFQDVSGINYPR